MKLTGNVAAHNAAQNPVALAEPVGWEGQRLYAAGLGIGGDRFGPHVARSTAAANAPDQGADIAKVREWLGHANVSTTRVYDHRKTRPGDSPVFEVSY